MNDDELRAAIREAHALGLAVLVKPHVWVPQSWAGAVTMHSQADWQQWFASYQREITHIARIAESEKAEALAIGTELSQTILLPQWNDLIVSTREIFSGRLLYVAHNVEEAETVPFWDSARRHRRFALSTARQRRRSRLSPRRHAGVRRPARHAGCDLPKASA